MWVCDQTLRNRPTSRQESAASPMNTDKITAVGVGLPRERINWPIEKSWSQDQVSIGGDRTTDEGSGRDEFVGVTRRAIELYGSSNRRRKAARRLTVTSIGVPVSL